MPAKNLQEIPNTYNPTNDTNLGWFKIGVLAQCIFDLYSKSEQ